MCQCVCEFVSERGSWGASEQKGRVKITVVVRVAEDAGCADHINCLFSVENLFRALKNPSLKQNSFIKTFTPAAEQQ